MKNSVLFVAFILSGVRATGQNLGCDTLFLKSGLVVPISVQSVTRLEVIYDNCGQLGGSHFRVKWPMVREIHYANGSRRNEGGELLPPTALDSSWVVETDDGNEYVGVIRDKNADHIVLETSNVGKITLLRGNIRRMTALRPGQLKKGGIWYDNPHATRYFFGPNGYGLRKGEAYYQNAWVLCNQVSVGMTDHFTLGLGMLPLFLFNGPTPIWIAPKFSIPLKKDKLNLGVGALVATVLGDSGNGGGGGLFGAVYGQLTIGSRDQNVNLGLGYGYAGNSWANLPTISFSTMLRAGKRFAFISENYLIGGGYEFERVGLLSAGCRFLGRRMAIDGALVVPTGFGIEAFIAIPWLGLNVPFGEKKE